MLNQLAAELRQVVESARPDLDHVSPGVASHKASAEKWSIQEILGHLIDSASNNHQRFVRALAADSLSLPGYEQNVWVESQGYNGAEWTTLLGLWRYYNLHLAAVIDRIPESKLNTECRIGNDAPVSLGYLAEDYVRHLKHHLAQISHAIQTSR